jgi:hypothetical protein
MDTSFTLDEPLKATGHMLQRSGDTAAVVVVGGTALNLLGVVARATADVDVIAVATVQAAGNPTDVANPIPLPPHLVEVVEKVARDFGLPNDWMNAVVGSQWETGLPPQFETRVAWSEYGGLWVGLPGRIDLVFFKLYAAADDIGPSSRHFKDLVALHPTFDELREAAQWIQTQDPSPAMAELVAKVIEHVVERTR